MPERTHLSIGEVLSLLRDEFPDVTISKIRFLESQSLVDPERTPSGYRKFYDQDVERLRWILRQQREHFLPLKVIRGRLTEGSGAEPNGTTITRSPTSRPDPRDRGETPHLPGLAPPAREPEAAAEEARPAEPVTARARHETEPADLRTTQTSPRRPQESAATHASPAQRQAAPPSAPPARPAVAPAAGDREARAQPAGAQEEAEHASGAASRASIEPRPQTAQPGSGSRRSGEETESYSADELASAAGAEPDLVTELKQYGLINVHAVVGGTAYFDETALAVTRAAAGFARHGVEARHLRAWRNSADREAALFEQLIMPLLRQRNPQARRQAADTVSDLFRLGGELRDALLQRALRDIR
ncbi:MAG TPA: MerR family transcriptional regulator [Acidimicrobiales bacterium]|nr:MerR family transcriptional regulator [Acidimicrobiales bacterium]